MATALDLNNPFSTCEIKRVRALEFGVFEPEFVKKMSVCEIVVSELYDGGIPRDGGLNDSRMGTTDYRVPCKSCTMDVKNCPGHFGHLVLAKPMYHHGFLNTVMKVLRCVCYGCSRLLIDADDPKFKQAMKIKVPPHRLRKILEICQLKKRCEVDVDKESLSKDGKRVMGGCGFPQPRYFKEGPNIMVMFSDNDKDNDEEQQEDSKRILSAEEAHQILRRISEDDMRLMGFTPERAQPSWMILTVLPIPPPPVRPYVQFGSDRSEDDLTLKLLDIVKTNIQLKKQELAGAANHVISEMCQLLQFHITTLFDNDTPGMPVATTRSKKPIKSIRARLKGKEGRLRGNLMGKRVDFSARTVITGDPNLPIDVIGVPKSIAMTLTFAETVTPLNYEYMKKLVENGPNEWPGAKYIIRDDGSRFDLRHVRRAAEQQLEYGYRVERHMIDGDFILFNRQPSLHKMSIMGHKTKILPFSTFRLNLSVTSPYNADFDGDEMNLHLAQSHETRAEIKHLMLVPRQIVSPQGNKPVMGIVQDSLLGLNKFTKRDTFLSKDTVMNLLMWIPYWDGKIPPPAILKPQPLWTGKQIITVLLKFDDSHGSNRVKINLMKDSAIAIKNDNPYCSENDSKVIIRRNEHLAGVICKRTAGSSSGSLIHILWHEAGSERTKEFLSNVQKVINNWLLHQAFTVGCADIIANNETLHKVAQTLQQSKEEVQRLVRLAQRGKLECQPGKSLLESFESRVNQELNAARETSGKLAAESLDEKNNIIAMVNAGSKGSTINISQIISCVGQQNVEGKRIPFGFSDRSLPHFIKHDYGPESRGFVSNSYLSGLTPQELFFHAMGGREGIIDTACKTSETGYIQRRLIKAMEDVMVKYDRTVRNSLGDILQFLYGEDGMGAEYIEDQHIELMKIDYATLEKQYKHFFTDEQYGKNWIHNNEMRSNILMDYNQQAILEEEYRQLREAKERISKDIFPDGEIKQHLPINIARLVEFAKMQFPTNDEERRLLNPVKIAEDVNDLLEKKLIIVKCTGANDTISQEVQDNATILIKAHLRTVLNSRRLMEEERIGVAALDWLYGEVERQFNRAMAHPGEVVGAIAAQSIGEPATQMTLNTFHFAGVGSKNVTLGVPRLKELINVAKTVKTPSLTVYLDDDVARDQERAKDVQTHLEHTTLEKVTVVAQVYYDPSPTVTIVQSDYNWVRDYYEFPDDEELPCNLGPWLLRIQLANKIMTDKKLTMKEVGERILQEFQNDETDCIWTDDNSEELVLRLRIKQQSNQMDSGAIDNEDGNEAEDRFLQRLMNQCLVNITLRGIPGISKVYMREEGRTIYNTTTGKFERCQSWVLDTDGCNLEEVLPVESVDYTRTCSNDITETFNVLGIEAVRRGMLRELRAVISFDGSYVNYRHLAVLCDTMTQKGHLMSITRHGINRIDRGPLMKCSFEETVEILMDAAMFAETDYLRGITENVMLGQLCPFGTGDFELLICEEKLKDANQNIDTIADITLNDFTSPETNQYTYADTAQSPALVSTIMSPMPFSPTYTTSPAPGNPLSPTSPSNLNQLNTRELGGKFSPGQQTPRSPTSPMSPFSPISDPTGMGFGSPIGGGVFSPTSPTSPSLVGGNLDTASPSYSPSSPLYTHTSPMYMAPNSPQSTHGGRGGRRDIDSNGSYSPSYSPTSPVYSPAYSPTSPGYTPTSPGNRNVHSPNPTSVNFAATSPDYSRSPEYSPTSPQGGPLSPMGYSPRSPTFSATSPRYSPTSPVYSPLSPGYRGAGPVSPSYSVQSPRYSPTSPAYSPTSPGPGGYSPTYGEASFSDIGGGEYSPTSPSYESNEPIDPFSPDPFSMDDDIDQQPPVCTSEVQMHMSPASKSMDISPVSPKVYTHMSPNMLSGMDVLRHGKGEDDDVNDTENIGVTQEGNYY